MTQAPMEPAAVAANPKAGDIVHVVYPFVRCEYTEYDEDGPHEVLSWRPGTEWEMRGGWGEYEGKSVAIAHDLGKMVMTVEAVFKPGRFPTRVFYTRKFITPEGKEFGKGGLRIVSLEKFRRLASGYVIGFEIEEYTRASPEPAQTFPAITDYHGFAGHAGTDSLPSDDLPF